MSRTIRKHYSHRTKTEHRVHLEELEKQFYYYNSFGFNFISSAEETKAELDRFGTEAANWGSFCSKALKIHTNRMTKTFTARELHKSYKDWDYEFDNQINRLPKGIYWYYD